MTNYLNSHRAPAGLSLRLAPPLLRTRSHLLYRHIGASLSRFRPAIELSAETIDQRVVILLWWRAAVADQGLGSGVLDIEPPGDLYGNRLT